MALDMVLAVYMPPHEPAPGHASHSILCSVLLVELAGLVLADRLEDGDDVDVLAVRADAGQDAAAVDEDARDVEPGHRHDAAGHVLVAAAEGETPSWFMPPATTSMQSAITSRETRL